MTLALPSGMSRATVTWKIGHDRLGSTLTGARGLVRFEASSVAVAFSDATVLPAPIETPVVNGVMTPVDLMVNDPTVWNWRVTPLLGVAWPAFHVDILGPTDLASAVVTPGLGPIRTVKGDKGDRGPKGERGPEGPYGGTSVTDPQVAQLIKDSTATRLAVKEYVDHLLPRFDVRDFGAAGDGVTDDTAAINSALEAAQVAGGVVVLPGARTWRLAGGLRMDGVNSQRVIIEGQDSLILTEGSSSTDPVLWVGNSAATSSTNNARRISIRDLRIQSHENWNSDTAQQRSGLVLEVVQDAYLENVWISGYSLGILKLYDVYDSVFMNVQLLKSTSSTEHALQLRGRFDQSNANHFYGLHIEGVPLAIGIYDNSRHNQIVASKVETGIFENFGTVSPIHCEGLENVFLGLHVTKNLVDDVPVIYSPHRDFVSSAVLLNNPGPSTKFIGCEFATPLSGRARWARGSFLKFTSCTFGRSAGQSAYTAIQLHTDSHILDCDVQMVPGHSGVITLEGTHSTVRDVTLRLNTNAATGTQLRLASSAAFNVVENFKIYGGGNPQVRVGSEITGGHWGSNVIRLHPGFSESRASATTIGDVRSDIIGITDPASTVQWITPRHDGARIYVVNRAPEGNLRFATSGNVHGAAWPQDRFVGPGQGVAFTCLAGTWYES